MDLKGRVALITGASSGIGACITKALLAEGMKVVGLARRVEKVQELAAEGEYEGQLFAVQGDITIIEDIERAFKWISENVGPIYVLINNAGITRNDYVHEQKIEDIGKVVNTNLLGLAVCTKEAICSMKADGVDGFIININSVAGHYIINMPKMCTYQATKYGVTAFTESTRMELAAQGSKIRITSISPGVVESEMSQGLSAEIPRLKGHDIANAVKYVLSQPPEVNITELTIRPTGENL